MLAQNSTSSKLYAEYVKAVVEEAAADATLRMFSRQNKRFEEMVEYNASLGVEPGELLWLPPSKRK